MEEPWKNNGVANDKQRADMVKPSEKATKASKPSRTGQYTGQAAKSAKPNLLCLVGLPVDLLELDGLRSGDDGGHELVAPVASVARGRDPLQVLQLDPLEHGSNLGSCRPNQGLGSHRGAELTRSSSAKFFVYFLVRNKVLS